MVTSRTVASKTYPATTPVATDAVDVIFPTLDEGRMYRVSMCNYIAENYIDKEVAEGHLRQTNVTVREAMLSQMRSYGEAGFTPDNNVYQVEVKR